jgi:tRNA threonylcarbamoyladenosine biosynthesis protein TsaE
MTFTRYCVSDKETQRCGEDFARVLLPGDIVLLSGQLGAGKTTFTKGVAKVLGVKERVTSPTFTMVREHACVNDQAITTLHHCDVYRVESLGEVLDLALGELVEENGVALVEWGELAASVFGRDVLTVTFTVDDNDARTLSVSGGLSDERSAELELWANK